MKIVGKWLPLLALLLSGCDGFFGKKTDLSFIEAPDYQNRDVAYVPIQPIMEGFLNPSDVIAGYDELIYAVDAGTEEIIAYDVSGRELGRRQVPGVTRIAQDRRMNILAIGTIDTIINDQAYTLSAIRRINLSGSLGYGIQHSRITETIVHPFYFKSSFSANDAEVSFSSVDVMGDNRYYVTRTGPRDSEVQIGGPDDGVLLFDEDDNYVSTAYVTTDAGLSRGYFRTPLCVSTYAKPPQSPSVSESRNFVVAMGDANVPIKVQLIDFVETDFGSSYQVELLDYSDTSKAEDFLYRPGRFSHPADVCITGDGTNHVLVVDDERDSLYLFTTRGAEGVNPPAGSSESKNIIVSFGGTGAGPTQFNRPVAVAYFDRIVYVCDAGNGRILRFRLTTDFD